MIVSLNKLETEMTDDKTNIENNLISEHRLNVPDTSLLQKRVLDLTHDMPQSVMIPVRTNYFKQQIQNSLQVLNNLLEMPKPLAIGVTFFTIVMITFMIPFDTNKNNVSLQSTQNLLLTQQLEWQDMMIVQDELMFASL